MSARNASVRCGPEQDTFIYVRRGTKWTQLDVDFSPGPSGELAAQARDLVLEGAVGTLRAGRRSRFWIHLPGLAVDIQTRYAEELIEQARRWSEEDQLEGGRSGVYITVVPAGEADHYVERFVAIADQVPPIVLVGPS